MDFAALRTELAARGFNDIGDTRLGMYVNRARARLDNHYRWPYREASGQGTAPLTIADLGIIEAVTNETQNCPLEESTYVELLDWFHDLSTVGRPEFWYRAYVSGDPVVATYPSNTDTIGVQFWQRCPNLVADADEPLAPEDYHLLIVDMAQQLAYRDSDNHQAAEAMQVEINRQLFEMVEDLLPQQEPGSQRTSSWNSLDW